MGDEKNKILSFKDRILLYVKLRLAAILKQFKIEKV